MAKKKKEDAPPAGSPAWMATFSDLMNLLLCFFVLLYAMSSVDPEKYEQVVASFTKSFSIFEGGAQAIGDGMLVSNGVSQLNELSEYINSMGATDSDDEPSENFYEESKVIEQMEEMELEASEQLADQIKEAMDEFDLSDNMKIDFNSQYVKLTLKGSLLFNSGQAEVREEAYPLLDKLSVILNKYAKCEIQIEGHTDNVPISKGRFASNNELSAARALSVFYYIMDKTDLDPANVSHSGRGEYVPIADNGTAEGRALNRRVEIKIFHELSSSK